MRLIITKDVGKWAALYVKEKFKEKKDLVLGLPTGGTAVALYDNLVKFYENKEMSFKDITTFNMDEYIGLEKDHEQSYWSFMQNHLFKKVDMNPKNINIPNGMAKNIKEECRLYEEKILAKGGVDLFLGGVGKNGHIAFNEPFSSLNSKTRDKELDKGTILANSRFFDNDVNKVPKSAISVGVGTLLEAKEVLIMITGESKARAVAKGVEGPVSHMWTISALQMHKKSILLVDEEAASDLTVRTYRYFKNLEDEFSYIEEMI